MSYLVKKEVVASCLERLRQRKTHEHFAGYLCLLYRSAENGDTKNIQPSFPEFFEKFYRVPGCPAGYPYIKPFISKPPTLNNIWLNSNVAGSYAKSSIRSTFNEVVSVGSSGYSLKRNHSKMALKHLLYSVPLNVFDLAIFLYRDFPLVGDTVTIEDVVSIFAVEFGYESPEGERDSDFETLFTEERPDILNGELLESV
jgi:hypothetical protein